MEPGKKRNCSCLPQFNPVVPKAFGGTVGGGAQRNTTQDTELCAPTPWKTVQLLRATCHPCPMSPSVDTYESVPSWALGLITHHGHLMGKGATDTWPRSLARSSESDRAEGNMPVLENQRPPHWEGLQEATGSPAFLQVNDKTICG